MKRYRLCDLLNQEAGEEEIDRRYFSNARVASIYKYVISVIMKAPVSLFLVSE